ncbi:hypothetical protein MASR1M101_10190 [Gemmatimonas sp.]
MRATPVVLAADRSHEREHIVWREFTYSGGNGGRRDRTDAVARHEARDEFILDGSLEAFESLTAATSTAVAVAIAEAARSKVIHDDGVGARARNHRG